MCANTVYAYVGSITPDPSSGSAPGITVISVDSDTGAMKTEQQVEGLQSPTYLALHPRLPILYAGERNFPPMGPQAPGTGAIAMFGIDRAMGRLTLRERRAAHAAAHLNIHPSGKYLVMAMNRAHTVAVFPL